MAKNKNSRKQGNPQDKASQQAEKSRSFEAETSTQPAQGSPADVARKHQRRFGHN